MSKRWDRRVERVRSGDRPRFARIKLWLSNRWGLFVEDAAVERWLRNNAATRARARCACGAPGTVEEWYGPSLVLTCPEHVGVDVWVGDGRGGMRPGVDGVDYTIGRA